MNITTLQIFYDFKILFALLVSTPATKKQFYFDTVIPFYLIMCVFYFHSSIFCSYCEEHSSIQT